MATRSRCCSVSIDERLPAEHRTVYAGARRLSPARRPAGGPGELLHSQQPLHAFLVHAVPAYAYPSLATPSAIPLQRTPAVPAASSGRRAPLTSTPAVNVP